LDDIVPENLSKPAVKIDVQGAEPFVVQGGDRTLKQAGLIIMEFAPYLMGRMDADPEVVLRFLSTNFAHLSFVMNGSDVVSTPIPTAEALSVLRNYARSHIEDSLQF
jgi:hypothetical protein